MSGTEILDPELNKDQGAVQAQVRHSMAVMAQCRTVKSTTKK